ncbi:MAG TPA: hypothetical protein PLD48_06920 [Bacillota bacterium]|nr:hypothetical protein [Bacillota bacterium]HOK69105.1 hypothetical protein [Bacillota bacterium]HPP85563.1 hypothetical protein [Bacillota bacterium]
MNRDYDFDKAFSAFIDGEKYDKTEDMLFNLVLSAFKAGWKAAGGEDLPQPDLISKYSNERYRFRIPEHLKEHSKKRQAKI